MRKKILLSIILILVAIIFSNTSLAWSPSNQTPIYPQNGYFCREKGGAVRFTQNEIASYYLLRFNSSHHNQYECSCDECIYKDGGLWPGDLDMIEAQGNDDLEYIFNKLKEYARPIPSNSEQLKWYNGSFPYPGAYSGPIFAKTPVMHVARTTTRTNDTTGYIFSSGRDKSPLAQGHKKGNYKETVSDTADDTMKQYALWADNTYNKGNILSANNLYTEAKEFKDFHKANIAGGYNVRIESSEAQVIANREAKTYIIGPYKVYYPDNAKFSYIEDIYVTANGRNVQPLQVIFQGKTAQKIYPGSGDVFFIEFSASNTGYPTSAEVNVKFCYLEKAEGVYEELEGTGVIGEVYQKRTTITKQVTGKHKREKYVPVEDPVTGMVIGTEKVEYYEDHTHTHKGMILELTTRQIGTYNAQKAAHFLSSQRIWKNKIAKASIDLRMNLGGFVWEDAESGKENIANGKIDNNQERKIPNVIVSLCNESGETIATTKTDNNGQYRFTGLNAMNEYRIKFTYNGQYYQPTTYSTSETWGRSGWSTNSNAKDDTKEREEFNKRFEKIGSSPANYANNRETFSKQELLGYTLNSNGQYVKTRQAVIDEFGNLILESSNDSVTKKMIQYVKDCRINSYTFGVYPYPKVFVISTGQYPSMLTPSVTELYNNAYYINLGLNPRPQSDLAVKKDVEKVTLEVNGQQHIYTYDTLENQNNAENTWDISLRLSDVVSSKKYYDTNYSRELYTEDYLYKVSNYGENFADYGKAKSDELEVYVTYKVMVRNQAMSIQSRVDEIVDYYDSDLQYVDERSYIEIKRGNNAGKYLVQASDTSRYENVSKDTRTTIDGYDNLYIRGLSDGATLMDEQGNATGNPIAEGIYLEGGQTAYVYLTFKVKKDSKDNEEWVRLDEEIETAKAIGVGKENIVELNGYSTRYANGTQVPNVGDVSYKPAGIVDRDSNPGNLKPADVPKDGKIKYENFEDDTDKAPNIRIILNRDDNAVRVISGSVWEDERNETIGLTTTGDGIRNDKDKTLINGVTVQLVELMENGTEYIWRTFENGSGTAEKTTPIINAYNLVKDYTFDKNHDGTYAFKSFMPGKYVVRFIYGDTVKTVTPASLKVGGLNEKSYNGQDFKSTTYQEGIAQNKVYTWREKSTWVNGQETLGKVLTEVSTFKPDATNNETANAKTNQLRAYLYDITASDKVNNVSDAKDIQSRRNQVIDYSDNDVTNYIAEVLASHKSDYETMNDRNTLLNDLMANTKMVAETGLMVIEFEYDTAGTDGNTKGNTYKIQNVDLGLEERPKSQLVIDKEVTNVKLTLADGSILFDAKNKATNVLWKDDKDYIVGYKGNFMDEEKFGSIQNIRNKNSNKFGLIQLSMDEELMHGATMEITYKVTLSNVGEVDYKDNLFYYTGNKSENAQIVKTRANQVIDYVANNLQFNASNNSNWKVISKDDIKSQGLVNAKLNSQVDKYNTIIVTESLGKDLIPELADKNNSSVSVPLVLTQLITSENDTDDLTYRNLVEIVKTSNHVGRRMEYSVVGNQDPESKPQELDSDNAEVVRILPPFGNAGIYIIITIVSLLAISIVIVGTIFIKKKVLRK